MNVQSDQKIVAPKTKILEHIKGSVSHAKKSNLKPAERINSKYERNQKALEECKKLGLFQFSHVSQRCHLNLQPVAPGGKACCQLSVNDSIGSPLPILTSIISCQLPASHGPQPVDWIIMNTGPSTYKIMCSPVIHGPHHLRVMVGDVDIPGSVFSVPILPPSFETDQRPATAYCTGTRRPLLHCY